MRSQIGASNNAVRYGIMSDVHSEASKLERYFSLIGEVDYHIFCGDAIGYSLDGTKKTLNLLEERVGAENCVYGNHDEEILKTPMRNSFLLELEESLFERTKKTYSKLSKTYDERAEKRREKFRAMDAVKKQLTEKELDFLKYSSFSNI